MSSFCKSYSHFFSKNISVYAIINDQSFNDMVTNDIVSFEQLDPGILKKQMHYIHAVSLRTDNINIKKSHLRWCNIDLEN